MLFRLTLLQNLPNRDPSAFGVTLTFRDGTSQHYFVQAVGPDKDVAVLIVDSVANLNQPNVLSRVLHAHYPTNPNQVDIQISSIQPAAAGLPSAKENNVMATNYDISITMSQETVEKLKVGGFQLYGFKGVSTTTGGGAPLVWFSTGTYSLTTDVTWSEQYQAYTSKSEIKQDVLINASASYNADLGQTLEVRSPAGTGAVVSSGTPGALTITSQITEELTCGVAQAQNGKPPSMLCAFPLYGGFSDVIMPIQRVLLMFTSTPIKTATVIMKAYSPGMLIDLTGVTERDVSFDINKGWSWDGGAWGRSVPANADLVPLLIDASAPAARALRRLSAHAAPKALADGPEIGSGIVPAV